MGQIGERYAPAEKNDSYLMLEGMTTTMDDVSRAMSLSDELESCNRHAVDIVKRVQESAIHRFMAHVYEIAKEGE